MLRSRSDHDETQRGNLLPIDRMPDEHVIHSINADNTPPLSPRVTRGVGHTVVTNDEKPREGIYRKTHERGKSSQSIHYR
jgi:hypothetical protein